MSKKKHLRHHAGHSSDHKHQEYKGSLGEKLEEALKKKTSPPEQPPGMKAKIPTKVTIQVKKTIPHTSEKMVKVSLKPSVVKKIEYNESVLEYKEVKSGKKPPISGSIKTPSQIYEGAYEEEREIVIGFDLGSSCSKVILQDRQLQKCYAVPFPELGYEVNRYLLPTKMFVRRDGQFSLNDGDYEYKRIKLSYIQDPNKEIFHDEAFTEKLTAMDLFACYIGLTLVEIRKWFFREKYNQYKHINISWQLNIGLPSKTFDNEELFKRTRISALAAWNISLLPPDDINIPNIKSALSRAASQLEMKRCDDSKCELHPDVVNAVPEIIAEVVGYARSPLREDGMYMLMDIGAVTLDISCFIIRKKDDEDNFPMLTSSVQNLGTFVLHNERIKNLKMHIEKKIDELCIQCDEITPVPEPGEYLELLAGNDVGIIKDGDIEFKEICSRQLREVIKETKLCRNPLSDTWKKGLPIFLCGGGSLIDLYLTLPRYVTECLQKNVHFSGFEIKSLPRPTDLEEEDLPLGDYHRMAVSYGLSFSILNIGTVTPEREIEDIDVGRCKLDLDSFFVSKDLV